MAVTTERHNRGGARGLGYLWHRWLTVVALVAHVGTARGRVDPDEYRALLRELLEACRTGAEATGAGRELCEQMERLVAPWVSVAALEQAGAEVLNDLLALGRLLGRQVGGRRWRVRLGPGWAWFFVLAMLAAGATFGLQAAAGALSPLIRWGVGKVLEARSLLLHSGYDLWLFAGAAVLTVLAIYLVSRTARR
jgi:hypothetical protein